MCYITTMKGTIREIGIGNDRKSFIPTGVVIIDENITRDLHEIMAYCL